MINDQSAMSWHSYMDLEEFCDQGYLQEVNRRFFHPLGLHLHVGRDGPSLVIRGVIDCREDPAGVVYEPIHEFATKCRQGAAAYVGRIWTERGRDRLDECGYMIQPDEKL